MERVGKSVREGTSTYDVNAFHQFDDVDKDNKAHHHSLGLNAGQAAPGDLVKLLLPVGSMLDYPVAVAPQGWLICDGSNFDSLAYPELAKILADTFGVHAGNNYVLPDFRGRMPLGVSGTHALASVGGAETHVLTVAQMPNHAHTGLTGNQNALHDHKSHVLTGSPAFGTSGAGGYSFPSGGTPTGAVSAAETLNHQHPITAEGGGGAHNNMPPFITVYKIIKAV